MKSMTLVAATAVLGLAAATAVLAQPPAPTPRPNAIVEFPAKDEAKLTVTTPAWKDGADIPYEEHPVPRPTPSPAWNGPRGPRSTALLRPDRPGHRQHVMRGAPDPALDALTYPVPR